MEAPNYTPLSSSPKVGTSSRQSNSNLALISMILGIASIVTFTGLLLGIPAVILGIVALRRKAGEKGMSIVGIITGAISTLLSLVMIGFIIMLMVFAGAEYEQDRMYEEEQQSEYYNQPRSSSSEL